jgi:polyisoprenyl-teichoic acid--peptidoglycan teichoic acid transferase
MRTGLKRLRRYVAMGAILAATAVGLPDSGLHPTEAALVKVDVARGIDHPAHILWILCIGSDARPGENVLRSRGDTIQLVGINLDTGSATIFGVPRDSWVAIDGVGHNRVNAGLYFGGPQLMAKTVGDMFGIQPDYVFVTSFLGLRHMVQAIGGITVDSDMNFSDDNIPGHFHVGKNRLNGFEALAFSRMRHFLPRGDFDRSHHQQLVLEGILREVRKRQGDAGFMERGMFSALQNMSTDLSPAEFYRLAQAGTDIVPSKIKTCVLNGTIGNVGGASIVFPDLAQAHRIGADAKNDATLDHGC